MKPERGVKYWVVGSNYQHPGEPSTNIFDKMVEQGGIAIGYLWGKGLSAYYLEDFKDVVLVADTYYQDHKTETMKSTRDAMRHFMKIAPGDLVAIKGSKYVHAKEITIVGYARIVERDDVTYRPSTAAFPEGLGHILNADFLVDDIERRVPVMLGASVHHVDPAEDPERWQLIFGAHVAQEKAQLQAFERAADPSTTATGHRAGTDSKNTAPTLARASSARVFFIRPYMRVRTSEGRSRELRDQALCRKNPALGQS